MSSFNLIHVAIFKRLGPYHLKLTRMCIQMVDRSVKVPLGIIKDLVVQVGEFVVPADFVVLEMDHTGEAPLILGRPFLATMQVDINVANETMTLNADGNEVKFDLYGIVIAPLAADDQTCFEWMQSIN